MADISRITLPSGTTYDIKDAWAREQIGDLSGAMHYAGITTTALTDGSTTATLTIDETEVTFTSDDAGAVVIYDEKEFVWNGTKWQEFGSTGSLKALAFKDSASGNFTPAGSVSQPTFTGSSSDVSITASESENGNYTPSGNVTAPTISVQTAGSTTSVTPFGSAGSLPSLSATVSNEVLTLGFSAGTLPSAGTAVTVKTGDAAYQASVPTFSGTKVQISGTTTAEGSVSQPTFTGTQGSVTVS